MVYPVLSPHWLRNLMRAVAVGMAAIHSFVAVMQQSMNEDGINYLDMGDAYLRGDWDAAINGVWSPAYGVLIAAVVRIGGPSMWWEFPTVQIVNFVIFVLALLAFEFFWNRLGLLYYRPATATDGSVRFPPAAWLVLGYSLFTWTALDLIQVWSVTPDMSVAAIVYLAAGLMLKSKVEPDDTRRFVLSGLLLGFGYLVKAALLPLGIVVLVLTALTTAGPAGRRAGNLLAALTAMLLVAGPLLGALSWSAGHLTMGDVGRFTYLKHVNEMPYPDFHPAVERLRGAPESPPRRIFDEPPIYEFAEPIAGTYPIAYDPGYWTTGLAPEVTVTTQARALITSAMIYFDLFVREQGGFLGVISLLGVISIASVRQSFRNMDAAAILVLWSLAAFAMYSVVHVLPRYIAPFVTLFWAGLLVSMRFPAGMSGKRFATVAATLLTLFVWVNLAVLNLDGVRRVTGFTPLAEGAAPSSEVAAHAADHAGIAGQLLQMGLRKGDRVAFIGYSFTEYWARLARLRIVAEIHWHDTDRFWNAPGDVQAGAIAAFSGTGAVAVIAAPVELEQLPPGWQPVGDSGYLLFMLP